MRRLARLLLLTMFCLMLPRWVAAQQMTMAEATSRLRERFAQLDTNQDRKLDPSEFLASQSDAVLARRNFSLFDFDANGFLADAEFAAIPGQVPAPVRGTVPDPFDALVNVAVAAMDESYEGWNQRPRERVNAHTFVANFLGSISPESKLFVTGRILRQADPDADGLLSRVEARRFLQQQLGFWWYPGPPLREPTGRAVRFDWFLEIDADQSGSLSHAEFQQRWPDPTSLETTFQTLDHDGNGQVSYDEYADPDRGLFFDPVQWFCDADTNRDALLDRTELLTASDASKRHLVASTFSGFDSNQDQQLDLPEYRLSLHANVNFPWHRRPVDRNRDHRLSYDEFEFHSVDLFHLQRRYYFHRLDQDANGTLDRTEFSFQSGLPDGVHLGSFQQEDCRLLYRDPKFPNCGWPVLSPDGTSVLFHRRGPDRGTPTEIVRVDTRSGDVMRLIDGEKPSWSRDGRRFVCRRPNDANGLWIVDHSGTPRERIATGKAANWSPDGRFVAFLSDNGLWIHDVAGQRNRRLLERDEHSYLDLGDDVAWSPDCRRIAVVGRTPTRAEIMLVQVEDGTRRVCFQSPANRMIGGQLSWSHQSGLVFRLSDPLRDTSELRQMEPDGDTAPSVVPWLDPASSWKSACVSPDEIWYTAISYQ